MGDCLQQQQIQGAQYKRYTDNMNPAIGVCNAKQVCPGKLCPAAIAECKAQFEYEMHTEGRTGGRWGRGGGAVEEGGGEDRETGEGKEGETTCRLLARTV